MYFIRHSFGAEVEFALYGHLQAGSIPPELCPVDGTIGDPPRFQKDRFPFPSSTK